jgi:hypothetical protein
MVNKTLLVKIDRISAWILLVLMILFFITGYSMTAEYGMNKVIGILHATQIHTGLSELVLLFFAIHAGVQIYFALLRRGVLGKK